MKTILRLEAVAPHGIYCSPYTVDGGSTEITDKIARTYQIINTHHGYNTNQHPAPWEDKLLRTIKVEEVKPLFFGFVDEQQFRAWFNIDACLKELGENGVTLVCYKVSHRIDGETQALAPKTDKKPENEIFRIPLTEYLVSGISKKDVDRQMAVV